MIDPSTGLIRTSELIPSTSNTYGALGIGISANGKKGDGQSEKRRKVSSKRFRTFLRDPLTDVGNFSRPDSKSKSRIRIVTLCVAIAEGLIHQNGGKVLKVPRLFATLAVRSLSLLHSVPLDENSSGLSFTGLRYAKLKSRLDKQASGALPAKKTRA